MAAQKHSVKLELDASQLVASSNKAANSVKQLGSAQDYLNKLNRQAAAIENPFLTVRQKHADQLAKLKQLLRDNAITTAEYQKGVAALKSSLAAATKNQMQMNSAQLLGRTMTRQSRAAFGQLGYQIQDIAVQLQMGQNAMLVFAQQGSQIASLMGPGGALLGAVLAVGGAIAMAFLPSITKATKSVEELADELTNLEEKMPSGIANILGLDVADIQLKATSDAIPELLENRVDALEKYEAAQRKLADAEKNISLLGGVGKNSRFLGASEDLDDLQENVAKTRKALLEANIAFNKNQVAVNKAREAIDLYTRAANAGITVQAVKDADELSKELENQINTWGMTSLQVLRYRVETEAMTNAQREAIRTMIAQLEWMEMQKQSFEDAQNAAKEYGLTLEDVKRGGLSSLEDGLVGLIEGTKSVSEAFRDMARSVISSLIRMQIQNTVTKPLADALNISMNPGGKAIGGSVTPNKPYIVGEKGPELFIPSGAGSITKNSDLQGSSQPIVQNINVTTGVSQTVRAEIANMMPQIIRAAQSATADARMRGGSYSSAMGA